jgi:hypothetical protein
MHSAEAENPRGKFPEDSRKKPVTPGGEPVTVSSMQSETTTVTVDLKTETLETIRSIGRWHVGCTDSELIRVIMRTEENKVKETIKNRKEREGRES